MVKVNELSEFRNFRSKDEKTTTEINWPLEERVLCISNKNGQR